MKLDRFYIRNHLLLQDLDLRFNRPGRLEQGDYALDFLVGLNGSGKSTILRSLGQVYAALRTDQTTTFDYTLEYRLGETEREQKVTIRQTREIDGIPVRHMTVTREGSSKPAYDADAIDQNYLPDQLVVYTTGSEEAWEKLSARPSQMASIKAAKDETLADPRQRSLVELPGAQLAEAEKQDSQILLIRNSRLPTIALCGFLVHQATVQSTAQGPLQPVLEAVGMQRLAGFSLLFHIHPILSPLDTFDRLKPLATRHIQQGARHLLVFNLPNGDASLPQKLLDAFTGSLALFQELDALQEVAQTGLPTLQQVNLFFERSLAKPEDAAEETPGMPRLLLFNWLSDGEQSFLARMALMAMLDTEDSLILLDEPEVHFNDYWKREIVNLLATLTGHYPNQLLVTTHSMIVISDVTASQVLLLVKGDDGRVQVIDTLAPTFGADPGEIMNDLLGTGRPGGVYSRDYLKDALKRGDLAELTELVEITGPGYWRFRIRARIEELHAASH